MEQDDDNESTKSEVKLGKLQFQLDYDFTKNEVWNWGKLGIEIYNVHTLHAILFVPLNESHWS